jgi:hypothetical protein
VCAKENAGKLPIKTVYRNVDEVRLLGDPDAMQQHGELESDGDDGTQ